MYLENEKKEGEKEKKKSKITLFEFLCNDVQDK